jgi:Fic family protein
MLGTWILQPTGYKAFIPSKFPPSEELFRFDAEGEVLHANAAHLLGKLDGITQLLPDLDFFLFMYLRKEATLSNQIEGTRATLIDALEDEAQLAEDLPTDVKKIQQYVQALNYGLQRLNTLPLSLRLIREIHSHLLTDIGESDLAQVSLGLAKIGLEEQLLILLHTFHLP